MNRITLLLILLSILLIGCAAQGEFTRTDSKRYPSKPTTYDIPIMTQRPDTAFKEIGIVSVTKQSATTYGQVKQNDLIPELKKQGRQIGADALIDLKFETFGKSAIFSSRQKHALKATATAIIYVK